MFFPFSAIFVYFSISVDYFIIFQTISQFFLEKLANCLLSMIHSLYNFEYNKLDNTAYEDLKNNLKGIDTSLERNEAEQKLKSLPEDNLYVKKLESFFDKDVFHMKKNPSNISYLNSKYTYVIEKDYENNLIFFILTIKNLKYICYNY